MLGFFLACLSALMCKLPISLRVVVIVKLEFNVTAH